MDERENTDRDTMARLYLQIDLYQTLLQCVAEQRLAIKKRDTQKLQDLTMQHQAILKQIRVCPLEKSMVSAELLGDSPNQIHIRALLEQIADLIDQVRIINADSVLETKQVLKDTRTKLVDLQRREEAGHSYANRLPSEHLISKIG